MISDGTEPPPNDRNRDLDDGRDTERDDVAPDLESLAIEIADVERALERLDDGSYWTDEITGEPIGDEVLAANPTARRAASAPPAASPPPASEPGVQDLADDDTGELPPSS